MAKEILSGVNLGDGTVYVPGMEDQLAKVITQKQIDHLAAQGAISGEWKSTAQAEKAAAEKVAMDAQAKADAAQKAEAEAAAKAAAEKDAAEKAAKEAAEAAAKNK